MIGGSAGRSAGNVPRVSARRRFSDRERDLSTPLADDPQSWPEPYPTKDYEAQITILRVVVIAQALAILILMLLLFS